MYVRKLALDYHSKWNNQPILFDNIREFWRDDHFDQDLEITANFLGWLKSFLWNSLNMNHIIWFITYDSYLWFEFDYQLIQSLVTNHLSYIMDSRLYHLGEVKTHLGHEESDAKRNTFLKLLFRIKTLLSIALKNIFDSKFLFFLHQAFHKPNSNSTNNIVHLMENNSHRWLVDRHLV